MDHIAGGCKAPVLISHQRQLSLSVTQVQERLIKNKTLFTAVEPAISCTSLQVVIKYADMQARVCTYTHCHVSGPDRNPPEEDWARQGGPLPVQHHQARGRAGGYDREEPNNSTNIDEISEGLSSGKNTLQQLYDKTILEPKIRINHVVMLFVILVCQ